MPSEHNLNSKLSCEYISDSTTYLAKMNQRTQLRFSTPPKNVLIVTKLGDASLLKLTIECAQWYDFIDFRMINLGLTVYVQKKLLESFPNFQISHIHPSERFKLWDNDIVCRSDVIDFIVTFGGDGTVLFAAWLFQTRLPPILPFNLGSLGFMTVFDVKMFKPTIMRVIDQEDGMRMNYRMRFHCTINREGTVNTDEINYCQKCMSEPSAESTNPNCNNEESFHILNDVVIDRGPSPYLSNLELYGDGLHITTVQADGLVIATPTGSTAYSLSAGGSLVHPFVAAKLVTPICPHTLNFRPMILPDAMDLRICVPKDSRATAWVSFDGRHRVQLLPGDSISVCSSSYPVPTVCEMDQSRDWFGGLEMCLAWNRREKQKAFDYKAGI